MANNLHRVLTAYSATPVQCDHPAVPSSGDPVRVGVICGIALTDEQFGLGVGGYRRQQGTPGNYIHVSQPADPANKRRAPDGTTPVTFQLNEWRVGVKNEHASQAAGPGTLVYYIDAGVDGVNLVVNHSGAKQAFAGILQSTIAADTKVDDAVLLLMQSAAGVDLT